MTEHAAITHARTSAEALQAVLHTNIGQLIAPEVCDTFAETKSITWNLPDLFDQLAQQILARAAAGGLRDDRGPCHDPTATAAEAAATLRSIAETWRTTSRAVEVAHNALAHLADNPQAGTGR